MSDEVTLTVGSRVQKVDYEQKFIFDGVIENITPPKREKPEDYWKHTPEEQEEMITFATVKWDNGTSETLDIEWLEKPDTEMEREFRRAYFSTIDLIEEKLEAASTLISEAVKIAEKAGVPFRSYVSPLSNSYCPRSRVEKFPDLDNEFVNQVTDTYDNEYGGWRHSAVC
jgi:hypothetical protein